MKTKVVIALLAALIAAFFYASVKLVGSDYFATAFVFGLSLSLLVGRYPKRLSEQQLGEKIGEAIKKVLISEKRQGGSLKAKQEHSCAYLILHQVEGIHSARAIIRETPEHLHSMKLVKMTHYDPVSRKYWCAAKSKKTNQTEFYVRHLGHLQTHANQNPPRLIPLESIENAINEITKSSDWQGGQLRYMQG